MNATQVTAVLRDERKKLLAEQKKRQEKILVLYQEQQTEAALDRQGQIWGETQFQARTREDERSTDAEARHVPDYRNPEKIAMMQELWAMVSMTVQGLFGKEAYKLFLEWLAGSTVAELAEEKDVAFTALLRQIKAMVAACRKRVGEDPDVFPFREKSDPRQTKRVNNRRAYARMLKGESMASDEAAKVHLSPEECLMKLDPLWKHLKEKGYEMARSQAWRAKVRGWFYPNYNPTFGGERLELTAEEQKAPSWFLKERFGITIQTAKEAKRRGWIGVDVNTRDRITIPEERSIPPEVLKLPETTTKVELTVEEREAFQEFLAKRFGISTTTASRAKRVGWFEVNATNRSRVRIPEDRSMPAIFPGMKIRLNAEEKKLSLGALVQRFGIGRSTAQAAKRRGYFVVMEQYLDRVKIPADR